MSARRPILVTLGLLCVLVCVLVAGAVSAGAAVSGFGSGPGSNPGEFRYAYGLGIDQSSGDVYVADRFNNRVEMFDGAGGFLSEWGSDGTGAGQFANEEGASGVAVDNELGSLSYGDVYVVDWGNNRVEKFDSEGKFLLMFGGDVNEKAGGDVCVAGEACTKGSEGSADGQFEWSYEGSYIAVGPNGRVYVGDKARVQVFEPSGVWRESISLAGLSSTAQVYALAVNASGDIFVQDGDLEKNNEIPGVREFAPDGSEALTQFDAGSTTVKSLAVNGSGDLFVGDSSGGFHLLEFDPAGGELESFGSKTLESSQGMAFAETSGELYVSGPQKVWVFTPPLPGPLVEVGSVSVTAGLRGHAAFEALVNPEGSETAYRYEYVGQAQFEVNGYTSAVSTSGVSIGSGFEDRQANASVEGLIPGVTYHYRVVASNANGTARSPDQSFEETPSALVDGPWAVDVASTSVTLAASIDPLGASTAYRLEWGASATYGHVLSGNVGEGMSQIQVSDHLQELMPDTTYHYRIVTSNEVGSVQGVDHVFTTQAVGDEESALPDGRAWELVSPADKHGAVIEPVGGSSDVIQAATGGGAITYRTEGPAVGEDPLSRSISSTVVSRRVPGGWGSLDIDMPRRTVKEGESTLGLGFGGLGEFPAFSPDLSLAVAEPTGDATPLLSADATERTLYLRDDTDGSYLPLVTPADVSPGTKFGGEESIIENGRLVMKFVAATPDLDHVVFESPLALVAPAVGHTECESCAAKNVPHNLYEWAGGRLQLVNVLPDGESTQGNDPTSESGASLAGEGEGEGSAPRAVSSDGRWVAWTWENPYKNKGESPDEGLYVRDMIGETTLRVGGRQAKYQTMNSEGSRIFYIENGELYEFDTGTGTQVDITPHHGISEGNAGVKETVSDVSEDGSYVYFVATGALASGGVSGADNLYLLHDDGGEWQTSFVATLSSEDEPSWYKEGAGGVPDLAGVSSRVSPDGRYLAFMSDRSLTGYDNLDANSAQPDEEVFLYDALEQRLVCASCNPTGARPVGVLDSRVDKLLVDENEFWGSASGNAFSSGGSHWLAASIPGWSFRNNDQALYQPSYLSDRGRLFFNSADALVPQDTNGLEDVYEYEPSASGETAESDNCTTASMTFSARSGGCVSLISSGTSSSESMFFDASESGDDVFFLTSSSLVPADYDDVADVYDAHVCSASLPCIEAPVSSPPCTSGDSCKAAPSPQPDIFGPAPSATFSGTGNVVEEAKSAAKHKSKLKKHAKTKKHKKKKRKTKRAERSRSGRTSGKAAKR